uniref:Uncharacterized protein n=1 Tax=Physcomitrium patens TaxID=3218 RepID=A0A2K1J7F8_PHYPA|nr:hypothetical protein PHYPA_020557 [Physcomitrium patens]
MLAMSGLEKDCEMRDGRLAAVWLRADPPEIISWARPGFISPTSSILTRRE